MLPPLHMLNENFPNLVRTVAPQILTGSRIVFAASAIIVTTPNRLFLAAGLITLGVVTDGLDGFLARGFGVSSAFGALFDCFADYICFVIAPWFLLRGYLGPELSVTREIVLGLPLLTGALRYARNSRILANQGAEVRLLPGLATVFFAFLPVLLIFLNVSLFAGRSALTVSTEIIVTVFSLMMITPFQYPKLPRVPGLSPVIFALLAVMPFFATRFIALAFTSAGLIFIVIAPFVVAHQRRHQSALVNAHFDGPPASRNLRDETRGVPDSL